MSYSLIQKAVGNSSTAGAQTATLGSNATPGNALVIWTCTLNTGAQSISGNGNTYNFVGSSALANSVCLSAYFCQNINGGATAVATSDTGCYGIYAAEYSGLSQTGGALGSSFNAVGSAGLGANVISSGATGIITAPYVAFGFTVDPAGVQTATPNSGTYTTGNTLAWSGNNPGWTTGGIQDAMAEDIAIGASGTVTATFGTTGNKQFSSNIAGVFALAGGAVPFFTPYSRTQFFVTDTVLQF